MKEILKETNALKHGHFLLSSGKHSDTYVQCAQLLQYSDKAEKVIKVLYEQVKDLDIDVLVGPAMGGLIPAYELARQLGIRAIFTEKVDGKTVLRRNFEISPNERVLIVEDVVTTGLSSMEVIELVEKLGGEVLGIATIIDRTNKPLDYKLYSAIDLEFEIYEPKDCELCKEGIELVQPGSRKF